MTEPTSATASMSTRSSTSLAPSAAVASEGTLASRRKLVASPAAQEAFDEGRLDLVEIGLAVLARRRLPRIEMRGLPLRDAARLVGVVVPRAGTIVALAVAVVVIAVHGLPQQATGWSMSGLWLPSLPWATSSPAPPPPPARRADP